MSTDTIAAPITSLKEFLKPFRAAPETFTPDALIPALTALSPDELSAVISDLDPASSDKMIATISGIVAEISRNSKNVAEMANTKDETHSVLSITNMRDEYNKNFNAVAMACFLHRMIDEWRVPQSQRVYSVDDWVKDPSSTDLPEDVLRTSDDRFKQEHADVVAMMPMKAMFKEFLNEMFQFNPAIHAHGSYMPIFDESAGIVNTPAAQASARFLEKFAKKCSSFVVDVSKKSSEAAVAAGHVGVGEPKITKEFIDVVVKGKKRRIPVKRSTPDMKDEHMRARAEEFVVPLDTFERYNRYVQANYSELRGAAHDLFPYRDESDQSILIHGTFPNAEEASKYVESRQNDFTDTLLSVKHNYWAFTAATPQAHQKIIGKEASLAQSLLARREIENRMGAAMNDQRARNARRENTKRNLGADLDSEDNMTETQKEFMREKAAENAAMGLGAADRTEDEERELFHVPVLRVDGATGRASKTVVKVAENPVNQINDIKKDVMEKNPDVDLDVKRF